MQDFILDRLDYLHERLHRRRWLIRLGVAVVLVPYLVHFAHVRIVTPPVDPGGDAWDVMFADPPMKDPETDLLTAVYNLPRASSEFDAPTTAPAGMTWKASGFDNTAIEIEGPLQVDLETLYAGAWTPERRYCLPRAIDFVRSEPVRTAMTRIARLARVPGALSLPPEKAHSWLSRVRHAAKGFRARARYRMAETRDFDAAMADLQTVLELAKRCQEVPGLMGPLNAQGCRSLAYGEIMNWSKEFDLTREQASDLIDLLRSYCVDFPALWKQMLLAEAAMADRMLDPYYTRDEDGNGWFVPQPWVPAEQRDEDFQPALSLLNLLSGLVSDRHTIVTKTHAAAQQAMAAADLPYEQAVQRLGKRPESDRRSDPLNGRNPVDGLAAPYPSYASAYSLAMRDMATHAMAVTSAALSAWRTDHGQFPERLADLVPEYIDELPLDPISRQPLGYRRHDTYGFVLWSVGDDAVDNGGVLEEEQEDPEARDWVEDWAYFPDRMQPHMEWILVPVEQGEQGQ